MAKYHINTEGEAGPCHASSGRCPFGGELEHYSTPEDARRAYEKFQADGSWHGVSKGTVDTILPRGEKVEVTSVAHVSQAEDGSTAIVLPLPPTVVRTRPTRLDSRSALQAASSFLQLSPKIRLDAALAARLESNAAFHRWPDNEQLNYMRAQEEYKRVFLQEAAKEFSKKSFQQLKEIVGAYSLETRRGLLGQRTADKLLKEKDWQGILATFYPTFRGINQYDSYRSGDSFGADFISAEQRVSMAINEAISRKYPVA